MQRAHAFPPCSTSRTRVGEWKKNHAVPQRCPLTVLLWSNRDRSISTWCGYACRRRASPPSCIASAAPRCFCLPFHLHFSPCRRVLSPLLDLRVCNRCSRIHSASSCWSDCYGRICTISSPEYVTC